MHSSAIKWYENMTAIRYGPHDQSISRPLPHMGEGTAFSSCLPDWGTSPPLDLQGGGDYTGP